MTCKECNFPLTPAMTALVVALALLLAAFVGWGASGTAYAEPDDGQSTAASESAPADDQNGQSPQSEGEQAAQPSSSSEAAGVSSSSSAAENRSHDGKTNLDVAGISIGNDVFVSGEDIESSALEVAANLFVAGRSIGITKGSVDADAFLAAETIELSETSIGNNVFASGKDVTLSNVAASTFFLAGNNLDLYGTGDSAYIAGNTVFLRGSFEGDVEVTAANVVIDPYLVVNGELNVTADQEPAIASTTKIGSFNYNQADSDQNSIMPPVVGSSAWLWSLLMMFLGMLLLGVLMLALMRTEVIDSTGSLLKDRPLAIVVSGLVTIIALPLVIVALFVTGIGWTVALALLFLCIVITMFSGTYTAISIGRALMGRINKWVSSLIMIIVFAVLFSLPIANFVLGALCTLYFAGSVIQGWWVWRRASRDGGPDDDAPSYSEFTVPRGSHVNPPVTEEAVAPVPAARNIPSTNSADYSSDNWK